MTKFFIILALIWFAYLYLKKAVSPKMHNREDSGPKQAEVIIPCAHCGLHIPKSESIAINNIYFCSDAHRKAFLK